MAKKYFVFDLSLISFFQTAKMRTCYTAQTFIYVIRYHWRPLDNVLQHGTNEFRRAYSQSSEYYVQIYALRSFLLCFYPYFFSLSAL